MTDDTLRQLLSAIQKSDDGDFLRVLAETTLNRLMDFDAENAIGAARHERSADRTTYRNGFRDRTLETRVGALDLKIPKFRTGQSYYPGFILEPRRLMDFERSEIDPGDRFPREGAHRRHPGGVDQWRLDTPRRRAGPGHGHDRHLEEPGLEAVQGDRRARALVPGAASGR